MSIATRRTSKYWKRSDFHGIFVLIQIDCRTSTRFPGRLSEIKTGKGFMNFQLQIAVCSKLICKNQLFLLIRIIWSIVGLGTSTFGFNESPPTVLQHWYFYTHHTLIFRILEDVASVECSPRYRPKLILFSHPDSVPTRHCTFLLVYWFQYTRIWFQTKLSIGINIITASPSRITRRSE